MVEISEYGQCSPCCDNCGQVGKLQSCQCKEVSYCSKSCQKAHWALHMIICPYKRMVDVKLQDALQIKRDHAQPISTSRNRKQKLSKIDESPWSQQQYEDRLRLSEKLQKELISEEENEEAV
jgi:hypothetical protein